MLWSNLDLGKGHSHPSFGPSSIYITGNAGNDDLLYALSMDGKILWKTFIGRAWNASNPESRSTPKSRTIEYIPAADLAILHALTELQER